MSARILSFPISVTSSADGWVTMTPRGLRWVHIRRSDAQRHAVWLANHFRPALPVRETFNNNPTGGTA